MSDGTDSNTMPAHRVGIGTLFAAAVALLGLMLVALHGRGWIDHLRHPAATRTILTPGPADRESGHFAHCRGAGRYTCVIDGDTIWYRGTKIRLADINAPEISEPTCDAELELGEKARRRLTGLLNEGPFNLAPLPGRDTDVYGRKLRTITRGGRSLGEVLVAEGLAERWVGYRRNWCD